MNIFVRKKRGTFIGRLIMGKFNFHAIGPSRKEVFRNLIKMAEGIDA